MLRLTNAIYCAGLLGILAGRRQGRQALEAAGVFAVWAFLFGFLDRLTWGAWFQSVSSMMANNRDAGRFFSHSPSPWHYYLDIMASSFSPFTAFLTALLTGLALRRAAGLGMAAAAFFAIHSWLPHKEFRYMYPDFPLIAALVGIGIDCMPEWGDGVPLIRRGLLAAAFAAALISAGHMRGLTFGDLGHNLPRSSA
jgi:hypothetical protein